MFEADGVIRRIMFATEAEMGLKEGGEITLYVRGKGGLDEFNKRLWDLPTGQVRIRIEAVDNDALMAAAVGRLQEKLDGIASARRQARAKDKLFAELVKWAAAEPACWEYSFVCVFCHAELDSGGTHLPDCLHVKVTNFLEAANVQEGGQ